MIGLNTFDFKSVYPMAACIIQKYVPVKDLYNIIRDYDWLLHTAYLKQRFQKKPQQWPDVTYNVYTTQRLLNCTINDWPITFLLRRLIYVQRCFAFTCQSVVVYFNAELRTLTIKDAGLTQFYYNRQHIHSLLHYIREHMGCTLTFYRPALCQNAALLLPFFTDIPFFETSYVQDNRLLLVSRRFI